MKRITSQLKLALVLLASLAASAAHAQTIGDSAWRNDVKTVSLTRTGTEFEMPVLAMESDDRMVLQFDVLSEHPENLRYTIYHCDAQWRRDDLEPYEFMTGFESGQIENYDFSFTTLVPYIHYHQVIPGTFAQFIHSGNFVVSVAPDDAPDSILLTRRFCVSEQSVKIEGNIVRPFDGIDISRRQQVDVLLSHPSPALAPQYLSVAVQQNGRQDNRRWLEFSGFEGSDLAYRNRKCNIFEGGNNFRFFDMSNLRTPMYNVQRIERYGGETFAIIRPEEDRSRKHYIAETSLNGGMKVNIWDRKNPAIEADYVWVNISLPMQLPMMDGSVHIVGALTDWKLDSASRMDYNMQYHAYTKRLLLKQGYYAYQLLFLPVHAQVAETARLEGDHYEMANQYQIFVYQRMPSDRADRLIATGRVVGP